jgi:xanthine dehydrogenase accessory factor
MRDFIEKVASLRRGGQRFATATVVGRRAPVSAHLGDRAIVYADGRMEGFIGGACSQEIVRKQALASIRCHRARLVSIRPDEGAGRASDPDHVFVAMTCVSEGEVDVLVEPDEPPRRLVIVGATPVAEALARTAPTLDYDVVRIVHEREQPDVELQAASLGYTVAPLESLAAAVRDGGAQTAAVVASQGHYDEQALETILRAGAAYVGLVASSKRGATVRRWLEGSGAPGVDTLRVPAGLDLGARTAPDVALSILAEIAQRRASQALDAPGADRGEPAQGGQTSGPATAVDPVCSMDVDVATAVHTAEVGGAMYYFCCARCRTEFVKDPGRFLT